MENLNIIKQTNEESKQTTQGKYEVLKGFAHKIEATINRAGKITPAILREAKENGIVIVHATSEDFIEFEGAITHKVESTMFNNCTQSIKLDYDGTPLDSSENGFSKILNCFRFQFGWSWYFKFADSNFDYEIFNVESNGVAWCQGVCFYLKDLEIKTFNYNEKNSFGSVEVEKDKFYPRSYLGKINLTDTKTKKESIILIALSDATYCPILQCGDNLFVLPWEDILALACKSGFIEVTDNKFEIIKEGVSDEN